MRTLNVNEKPFIFRASIADEKIGIAKRLHRFWGHVARSDAAARMFASNRRSQDALLLLVSSRQSFAADLSTRGLPSGRARGASPGPANASFPRAAGDALGRNRAAECRGGHGNRCDR